MGTRMLFGTLRDKFELLGTGNTTVERVAR